jgi:hypothetical protein
MSTIEIAYRYIENNTRAEKRDVCTSLSEKGAIAIAVEKLDATELESGDYIYRASDSEGGGHYVVTAAELASLGAALHCRSGSDCYSLWCNGAGREATDEEIEELA